jgi:uracil-DNA glycosylase
MEGTVYLEDIETPREAAAKEEGKDMPPTTQVKRQLTLVDMFSGSQGKTSEPSAKKIRLSTSSSFSSTSSSSVIAVNGVKATGVQRLNTIPFSLSSFQDSLTEEQKKLLKLECEVMGKSW